MDKSYKKHLLSILLACSLTVSSCRFDNDEIKITNQEELTSEDLQDIVEQINIEDYKSYFNEDITFRNESFYENNNLFQIIKDNECKYELSTELDTNKIIENIKNNSKNISHEGWTSAFNEIDEDILNQILKTLITKIEKDKNSSKEDAHLLETLKIVCGTKNIEYQKEMISLKQIYLSNYDVKSNTIIINNELLKDYFNRNLKQEVALNLYTNSLYCSLSANLNVLRQNSCKDKEEASIYEEDVLNSLSVCAAESYSYFNDKDNAKIIDANRLINRDSNYNDESELLSIAIFNTDKDCIDNYYKSLFNEDYESLFKTLKLENEEDINNFKKIVKAMDAKNLSK